MSLKFEKGGIYYSDWSDPSWDIEIYVCDNEGLWVIVEDGDVGLCGFEEGDLVPDGIKRFDI